MNCLGIITGANGHLAKNVINILDNYVDQFRIFANKIKASGSLIYFTGDEKVNSIKKTLNDDSPPYWSTLSLVTRPKSSRNASMHWPVPGSCKQRIEPKTRFSADLH